MYILSNDSVSGSFSMALHSYTAGNAPPGAILTATSTVNSLTRSDCNFLYLWDVSAMIATSFSGCNVDTDVFTLSQGMFEVKLPVTTPYTVQAGTTYWITFHGQAAADVYIGLTDSNVTDMRHRHIYLT